MRMYSKYFTYPDSFGETQHVERAKRTRFDSLDRIELKLRV